MPWTKWRRRTSGQAADARGARPRGVQLAYGGRARRRLLAGTPRTPQGRRCSPASGSSTFRARRSRTSSTASRWISRMRATRRSTRLLEYCRRVASAVGLICIEIFGYRDLGRPATPMNLGIALQLTNIIRDVGVDLRRGARLSAAGGSRQVRCTEEDLRRGDGDTDGARAAGVRVRARHELLSPRRLALPRADAGSLVAAEIMGGDLLRDPRGASSAADTTCSRRAFACPRPHRALIALRTWARTLAVPACRSPRCPSLPDRASTH